MGIVADVWWADLTAADLALADRLPEAERQRVFAAGSPADQGRRLVAAALLQHAVQDARAGLGSPAGAGSTGGAGSPVEVDRTCEECGAQHGRPVVAGGPHLSVSHAGTLVVVATCAAPVGVDVERLSRFVGHADPSAAARAWTAREAMVKAAGPGTGGLTAPSPEGTTASELTPPLEGYVATLCVRWTSGVRVREHAWHPTAPGTTA